MNALLQTVRQLGPKRLAVLGGIVALVAGLLVFMTSSFTSGDMALLYAELDPGDSSKIVSRLDAMGVPYQLRGDGGQILVPREQVLRLRMAMAQDSLPSGGSIGYEIFDRSDALGTTSFVQQVNHLRALEGELARTIGALAQVRSARVHLVIPQRDLFSRDRPTPTASIVLMLRNGANLDKSEVLAIEHLVASAVPGLKPSAVSVVDNRGTLLARGDGQEGAEPTGGSAEELRVAFETRLTHTLEELLERSVGPGKIRAQVSAAMDFDRVTTNAEIFDPDGQVVRSTQTVDEKSDSAASKPADTVSVANNLPDPKAQTGQPAQQGSQPGEQSSSTRTEETVNYEVTKRVETHVREAGSVRRLSVAVLVDGTYETAADGTVTYKARAADELAQIDKLVRSAIGYEEKRGDQVEVVNMRFADIAAADGAADSGPFLGLDRDSLMRIAELLVLALVAILALLFVVRPLVGRLLAAAPGAQPGQGTPALTNQSTPTPALPGPAGQLAVAGAGNASTEGQIDVGQVEGRVQTSSLKKIGEIVERHPEEALSIMRGWMQQES